MNKRHEEKIQSMIRFEDSTLKEIRDYAEKYKSKLDRLGLKYSINLLYKVIYIFGKIRNKSNFG